jgi:hypothetical protein
VAGGVGPDDPEEIDSDSEDYILPNTATGSATGIAGDTSTADDLATNTSTVGPQGVGTGTASAAALSTALTYDESLFRISSLVVCGSGVAVWTAVSLCSRRTSRPRTKPLCPMRFDREG